MDVLRLAIEEWLAIPWWLLAAAAVGFLALRWWHMSLAPRLMRQRRRRRNQRRLGLR